jgi:hypothetical protein
VACRLDLKLDDSIVSRDGTLYSQIEMIDSRLCQNRCMCNGCRFTPAQSSRAGSLLCRVNERTITLPIDS